MASARSRAAISSSPKSSCGGPCALLKRSGTACCHDVTLVLLDAAGFVVLPQYTNIHFRTTVFRKLALDQLDLVAGRG